MNIIFKEKKHFVASMGTWLVIKLKTVIIIIKLELKLYLAFPQYCFIINKIEHDLYLKL